MNNDVFRHEEYTRRGLLARAAAAGLLAVPAGAALTGCASSGGTKHVSAGSKNAKNPLGVNGNSPLDLFIFAGGFGTQYAKFDSELYSKAFPKAKISFETGQQMGQKLQPRFVAGNPPDVIENSGAGGLDEAGLVAHDQVQDLSSMFNAPSMDDPNKTVKETLLPGVYDTGLFSNKPYILSFSYTVDGIWHSDTLFKQKGWEYPKTWDAMLTMCAMIKKTTNMSPWTFQGKYPNYILNPILQLAAKIGGADVLRSLDNLEPNAWLSDPVKTAGAAFHELAAKGYVLPGTPGLTHIQSQTKWAQGQAVFIPCGSWLENEIKAVTPKTFDMVLNPVPSYSGSDKLPFAAIWAGPSGNFFVPAQAKNVPGALEFLRIVLSKQASTKFSQLTHVLGVVSGYADAINVSTAFNTARDAVTAAGSNTLNWQFGTWYAKMEANVENATGALMADQIGPDEWSKRCQKAADDTKKDSSIKKYHR